ncbi:DUF4342 domain-containing protein [Candidatus Peregrinibacteria bacterium]|nr:DUF4342 domain-containing protein [Candidatus Peregrinibacteria bacterium]
MPTKKSTKKCCSDCCNDKFDFKVKGDELLAFIKKIIKEGNVRRIIIKDGKGKTYMEIPVTIGFVGVIAAPIFVAIGALAAMAGVFEVEVIKKTPAKKK